MHEQINLVNYIGETNFRNGRIKFGIKDNDRFSHIYCIGSSGAGKSTLLQNMALSDLKNGKGLALLDPHGDVAQYLIDHLPFGREKDLIIFDPMDHEYPSRFNPLCNVPESQHDLVASNLVEDFRHIWADHVGPRMLYILQYAIRTLMTYKGATLLHIKPLLTDSSFRAQVLMSVRSKDIFDFWEREFDKLTPSFKNEVIAPILNKVGLFHTSKALSNAFGSGESDFSIQEIIDGKKILIAKLSKGILGEEASRILGTMLTTAMKNAALARSKQPEEDRVPFFLYIDECHSFINSSFAQILSECRKYKLGVFLANQHLSQLDEATQNAIFANTGTLISFKIGSIDAQRIVQEFHPVFSSSDLIHLNRFDFYIKLRVDGETSRPFSATSLPSA